MLRICHFCNRAVKNIDKIPLEDSNYPRIMVYCKGLKENDQTDVTGMNREYSSPRPDRGGQDHKNENMIIGRNPVLEALRAGTRIDTLFVSSGEKSGSIGKILALARQNSTVIKEVHAKKLDFLCGHSRHQGVIAMAAEYRYAELDDLFRIAQERGEAPFFILCDGIEDPHNLGAIIRTADAAGAHGVIVPARRSAPLSFTVNRASAGALNHVPIARVTNLAGAMEELKRRGVFLYGADMGGADYTQVDFRGAVGLVIGSEGAGIGRLVREKCDFIVSLPMKGRISSLNASVAAGILMYEVTRTRR